MLSTRLLPRIKLRRKFLGTPTMDNAKRSSADAKPCPTCGAPATHGRRPFCSKRCADIDLGKWFQGAYAIPAVDAADDTIIDTKLAASGKTSEPDPGEDRG